MHIFVFLGFFTFFFFFRSVLVQNLHLISSLQGEVGFAVGFVSSSVHSWISSGVGRWVLDGGIAGSGWTALVSLCLSLVFFISVSLSASPVLCDYVLPLFHFLTSRQPVFCRFFFVFFTPFERYLRSENNERGVRSVTQESRMNKDRTLLRSFLMTAAAVRVLFELVYHRPWAWPKQEMEAACLV